MVSGRPTGGGVTLVDILSRIKKKQAKYFSSPLVWAAKIKAICQKELANVKVFLFGSILEKEATASSDIDILVVSNSLPSLSSERGKLKAKIYQKIGLFSPFEIHLVNEEEFLWYKRFIKGKMKLLI